MKLNCFKGRAGPVSRAILQLLLAIFAATNLAAGVLNAITAFQFTYVHAGLYKQKHVQEGISKEPYLKWGNNGRQMVRNPTDYLATSMVPFLFLAVIFFITWFITSLALLCLFTGGRQLKNRAAHYVFQLSAVITFIFLTAFYHGWSSLSLEFPFAVTWRLASISVVAAHINLAIAILLTLMAAVLDVPMDSAPDASTRPNGRRTSRV
ncbi:hypothetical protein FSARC_12752 [Fusarium sarcochroum]|uniref:Uncharacterized protein n=1 Tax=Fusarium sarcochroum TaxID=1208366 RepID=A0A8H4WV65_9HYPO|nr:hypothetical protein FSARC_12752 [Fusarium sarcochroum]